MPRTSAETLDTRQLLRDTLQTIRPHYVSLETGQLDIEMGNSFHQFFDDLTRDSDMSAYLEEAFSGETDSYDGSVHPFVMTKDGWAANLWFLANVDSLNANYIQAELSRALGPDAVDQWVQKMNMLIDRLIEKILDYLFMNHEDFKSPGSLFLTPSGLYTLKNNGDRPPTVMDMVSLLYSTQRAQKSYRYAITETARALIGLPLIIPTTLNGALETPPFYSYAYPLPRQEGYAIVFKRDASIRPIAYMTTNTTYELKKKLRPVKVEILIDTLYKQHEQMINKFVVNNVFARSTTGNPKVPSSMFQFISHRALVTSLPGDGYLSDERDVVKAFDIIAKMLAFVDSTQVPEEEVELGETICPTGFDGTVDPAIKAVLERGIQA